MSEEPKTANLVKLSGNFLITSVIESLGEAMALVGKAGVDKHQYLDILTSTLFGAPIYKTYGGLIAGEQFEPAGFAASLGQKDIRLVLTAAEELQVPMPVASLIRDRFLTLLARGGARPRLVGDRRAGRLGGRCRRSDRRASSTPRRAGRRRRRPARASTSSRARGATSGRRRR